MLLLQQQRKEIEKRFDLYNYGTVGTKYQKSKFNRKMPNAQRKHPNIVLTAI